MRDFLLNDEDRAFRAEVRDFLAGELKPRAAAIEAEQDWDGVKAAIRALGEKGYLTLMFSDLYRGELVDPGLTHATLLSEEAAAISYAFESTVATALSCAFPLHREAAPALRERYLGPIVQGREIGAICVTEPDAGSDTGRMRTSIRYDADRDEWTINGLKRYISNASEADVYIVYGITTPAVPAQRGMSAVIVPADTSGLGFSPSHELMGRRGCKVGEVRFRDCRVPGNHLLGERDRGFRIMLGMFNFERVLLGGAGLGVARSAFEVARRHAQDRVAFGQKLGSKQLIWDKVVEMSWRIDAAELLTHRAAKLFDSGALSGKQLVKPASMAKLVATQTANLCADQTVQILGADGLAKQGSRAEQIYRDARALTIVGGTSEMMRYLIACADLPELRPDL
ncbi:MAG: acyl-CoA dehydrogenase family protein [Thermoleophilaceae bacterium]